MDSSSLFSMIVTSHEDHLCTASIFAFVQAVGIEEWMMQEIFISSFIT